MMGEPGMACSLTLLCLTDAICLQCNGKHCSMVYSLLILDYNSYTKTMYNSKATLCFTCAY